MNCMFDEVYSDKEKLVAGHDWVLKGLRCLTTGMTIVSLRLYEQ